MPLRPVHCWARSRVSPIRPALDAAYAACGSPAGGEPEDRGDVDDARARLHHPAAGLRHPVAAVQVDVDDLPELLGRLLGRRDRGADAGVVHQDVDPAELLHRQRDQVGAGLGVGDVGGHRQRAAAGALHEGGGVGEAVDPPGAEREVRASLGQALRERDPQAAGGAGDDGDPAVEAEHVSDGHAVIVGAGEPRRARRPAGARMERMDTHDFPAAASWPAALITDPCGGDHAATPPCEGFFHATEQSTGSTTRTGGAGHDRGTPGNAGSRDVRRRGGAGQVAQGLGRASTRSAPALPPRAPRSATR